MNGSDNADEKIFAALWVGSPQSFQEYSSLYSGLIHATNADGDAPGPIVVFEDRIMPIDELVEAFTTDPEFVDPALSSARERGITQASMGVILFSSTAKSLSPAHLPNDRLSFLGMFPFLAEDAEEH